MKRIALVLVAVFVAGLIVNSAIAQPRIERPVRTVPQTMTVQGGVEGFVEGGNPPSRPGYPIAVRSCSVMVAGEQFYANNEPCEFLEDAECAKISYFVRDGRKIITSATACEVLPRVNVPPQDIRR